MEYNIYRCADLYMLNHAYKKIFVYGDKSAAEQKLQALRQNKAACENYIGSWEQDFSELPRKYKKGSAIIKEFVE